MILCAEWTTILLLSTSSYNAGLHFFFLAHHIHSIYATECTHNIFFLCVVSPQREMTFPENEKRLETNLKWTHLHAMLSEQTAFRMGFSRSEN